MRDIPIAMVDHTPRPIVALGRLYPDGFLIDPHEHRRGQLLSAASGLVVLTTTNGTWVMPPQRGMWIPPRTVHAVRMVGAVEMQSLYLDPDAVPGMPDRLQVLGISTFVRSLLAEAIDLPLEYDLAGRGGALMQLIQHEVGELPALPLSLQYPAAGELADRCRAFVLKPDIHATIDPWAEAVGMSRRTFTRFFRRETGLSFRSWCQQACLLAAIPRIAAGEAVTAVAIDLGYENPAAFTSMFKSTFGYPPLEYLGLRGSRTAGRMVSARIND